jgi:hypothetical protein
MLLSRHTRRREFVILFGSAATVWPLAANSQQSERLRRIGVLMNFPSTDSEGQARLTAFTEELQKAGWIEGRNVHVDARWGADKPNRDRSLEYRRSARDDLAVTGHSRMRGRVPDCLNDGLTSIVARKGTIVIDGRICMVLLCLAKA